MTMNNGEDGNQGNGQATGQEGNQGGNQDNGQGDDNSQDGVTTLKVDFDGQDGDQDKKGEGDQDKDQDKQANPWELPYKDGVIVVPEAFRNEDGTPNTAALAKSYDELRRRMGTGDPGDAVPGDDESYNFKLPDALAEQGIEVANDKMLSGIEALLRKTNIGAKAGQELFAGIAQLQGEQMVADAQAHEEAHKTFISDQIKSVSQYASKDDLDAWGAAAASMLQEDFKGLKFDDDPEKNKAHAMALHRGLTELNGSAHAVMAMNYLMKRVGGEQAIPSLREGGQGGGKDPREEMREIQASDAYQNGDPEAVRRVRELSQRAAKSA